MNIEDIKKDVLNRINKIIVKKECIFSKEQDDFVFNIS